MDIYVLNPSFEPIAVIDSYKSLIWTKRYYTCGDFELYIPADDSLLSILVPDNFISRDDDDTIMFIEHLEILTDAENGDYFIVSGRSLESVIGRRIVISQTVISEEDAVQGIKELIAGQTSGYREIPGLVIDASLEVPQPLTAQFTGDNLLDAVSSLCVRFGIGFKISLSGSDLTLSFYIGNDVDVYFSPEFDNLINSKTVFDTSKKRNFAKILGEGEGTSRIGVSLYANDGEQHTGFNLRELFVDAKNVSSDDGAISSGDYILMLAERGREKLAENKETKTFEAQIDPMASFRYKTDYNLGDTVTVTNEYGVTAHPRIVEIIESWDETGYTVIPTFDSMEVQ